MTWEEKKDFPSQKEPWPWRVYSLGLFTQHECGHQSKSVSLCFDTTIKGFHFIKSLINWDRLVFFSLCKLSFMAHLCSLDALMEAQKKIKRFHIKLQWLSFKPETKVRAFSSKAPDHVASLAHKPTPHTVRDRWNFWSLLLASACDFQSFLLFLSNYFQSLRSMGRVFLVWTEGYKRTTIS